MSRTMTDEYNDAYATCTGTYSTLRIFSDALAPEEVSAALDLQPTRSFRAGDVHSLGRLRRKTNGWFYSTKQLSDSKDTRRHIDLVLSAIAGKNGLLADLRERGCVIDLFSYWESVGQGGPALWPRQMVALGEAGIPIGWDIYFSGDDEEAPTSPAPRAGVDPDAVSMTSLDPTPSTVPHRNQSLYGWWIASYLERASWDDEPSPGEDEPCLAWENTVIVKAVDREEAFAKVARLASDDGATFEDATQPSRRGRWVFEGLTSLLPIYEELGDGCEVQWTEHDGVPLGKLRERVRAKHELEAFDDSSR